MRTAFFVYQQANISISTCESDLELCGMNAAPVSLVGGCNDLTFAPGVYKIDSNHELEIQIRSNSSEIDIASSKKTNGPTLLPIRATSSFSQLDEAALQTFLSAPDAKQIASP